MAIKEIEISNFKSLHNNKMEIGNFNILIGANASGKSNFIQFFKFLRDLAEFGLDDAVSMQGGTEYLFNVNHRSEDTIFGRLIDDSRYILPMYKPAGIRAQIIRSCYQFELHLSRGKTYIVSVDDVIEHECRFFPHQEGSSARPLESVLQGSAKVFIEHHGGESVIRVEYDKNVNVEQVEEDIFDFWYIKNQREGKAPSPRIGRKQTLIESDILPFMMSRNRIKASMQEISVYDIDPKIIKKAQPITGRHDLDPEGGNLAVVIRRLQKNANKKRQIENIINDLLPFVEGISIKKLAENLIIRMKERFKGEHLFPAFLLSDGTINLTALVIALFFEKRGLKIIEEPERNMHPHLMSKVVGMMRDASSESQIITTTHNPEIVRHATLDELVLVSRDRNGDSVLSKPGERAEIRSFLKHEMGMEELYIQNILETYVGSGNE